MRNSVSVIVTFSHVMMMMMTKNVAVRKPKQTSENKSDGEPTQDDTVCQWSVKKKNIS